MPARARVRDTRHLQARGDSETGGLVGSQYEGGLKCAHAVYVRAIFEAIRALGLRPERHHFASIGDEKQHVIASTHKTRTANGCKRSALQPLIAEEPMKLATSINPDAFSDLAILIISPFVLLF